MTDVRALLHDLDDLTAKQDAPHADSAPEYVVPADLMERVLDHLAAQMWPRAPLAEVIDLMSHRVPTTVVNIPITSPDGDAA